MTARAKEPSPHTEFSSFPDVLDLEKRDLFSHGPRDRQLIWASFLPTRTALVDSALLEVFSMSLFRGGPLHLDKAGIGKVAAPL